VETEVYITIGDVSSNDGVPRFIKPEINEVAYVPEVYFNRECFEPFLILNLKNRMPVLEQKFFKWWPMILMILTLQMGS